MAEQGRQEPMSDKDLLAIIGEYEKAALGSSTAVGPSVSSVMLPAGQSMTTLEIDRYNALNAYYARPLGNEIADRSQVVDPVLRDTVEWIMPQLMRMFASGKPCQFDAVDGGDEEQAALESEVVNQIFMRRNEGFFVLHDMFKDALLLRNSYANVYVEDERKSTVENYSGLSEMQVAQLMTLPDDDEDTELEVLGQEETQIPGPDGQPQSAFTIKLRRTATVKKITVEATPPEEMLVSPMARRSMDASPFVEHSTQKMRSELKEMGFDAAIVDSIAMARPTYDQLIKLARAEVTDELSEEQPADKASQYVDVRTVYIRIDFDGDGMSELRRVVIGGEKILENEECEEQSFAYCSPMRMPHRHIGISLYDLLFDLQVIKTTLWRQGLDNLYQQNNTRTAVDYQTVNVQDLLVTRPGGVVRVKGPPGESVMLMPANPQVMGQVMPALEYCDQQREMRTGVGRDSMGLDADALQDVTKGGQLAGMAAAGQKVEMIARMLAEGVKEIFLKIHRLLVRHQDKPMSLKIGGKWIEINPADWRERTSVSVNVGLGSGNREEQRQNLMLMMQMQEKLASAVASPLYKYAYESFKVGAHLLGFENAEKYAPGPDSPELQQIQQQAQQAAQNNPEMAKVQAEQQAKMAEIQADEQAHIRETQAEQQRAVVEQAAQAQQAQQQIESEEKRDAAGRESDMLETLIKVIGTIVASQLKQDASANAGQVLADDVRTAEPQIEQGPNDRDLLMQHMQQMSGMMQQLHGAMTRPKVATLSDGRQIRIE